MPRDYQRCLVHRDEPKSGKGKPPLLSCWKAITRHNCECGSCVRYRSTPPRDGMVWDNGRRQWASVESAEKRAETRRKYARDVSHPKQRERRNTDPEFKARELEARRKRNGADPAYIAVREELKRLRTAPADDPVLERLAERVALGHMRADIAEEIGCSTSGLDALVRERSDVFKSALESSAHALVDRALKLLEEANPESVADVNWATKRADFWLKIAGKRNPQQYGERIEVDGKMQVGFSQVFLNILNKRMELMKAPEPARLAATEVPGHDSDVVDADYETVDEEELDHAETNRATARRSEAFGRDSGRAA